MENSDRIENGPPAWGSVIKNFLGLVVIVVVTLGLDQFTKFLVVQNLQPNDSWTPIPALGRLIRITYIYNSGAAFGLFQNSGNVFIVIALVVAVGIVVYYAVGILKHRSFLTPGYGLIRLSLGLQLGGALGNMIDRLRFKEGVVDFVDIGFWPIFNVADVSIVAGVCLLVYVLWKEEEQEKENAALQRLTD